MFWLMTFWLLPGLSGIGSPFDAMHLFADGGLKDGGRTDEHGPADHRAVGVVERPVLALDAPAPLAAGGTRGRHRVALRRTARRAPRPAARWSDRFPAGPVP